MMKSFTKTPICDDQRDSAREEYMLYDVLCLKECVEKQLEMYGDDVASMPLTSTGYVRREARNLFQKDPRNWEEFQKTQLGPELYLLLKKEISGGLTHGNRFVEGITVTGRIKHRDFRSHYPSQQRCRKFPMGKYFLNKTETDIRNVAKMVHEGMGILIHWIVCDIELIDPREPLPILQECKLIEGTDHTMRGNILADNGRVLKATGIYSLSMDERDLDLFLKQYRFKSYNILRLYTCKMDYLPSWMTDLIDEHFIAKTRLKKEIKAEKKAIEAGTGSKRKLQELKLSLEKSKNILNGIAGMTETDPIRDCVEYSDLTHWSTTRPVNIKKELAKYYNSRNNFMRYQWGTTVLSWGRHELMEFCRVIRENGGCVLYVDTDSAFYLTNDKVEEAIEALNEKKKKVFVEVDGERVYYDQFVDEDEDITEFRFLHAKCYCYKTSDGEMTAVIAGVSAFEDATHKFSREDELGDIDNLENGFTFEKCGGNLVSYVINEDCMVDGHLTETCGGAIIEKNKKTLHDMMSIIEEGILVKNGTSIWEVGEEIGSC